MYFVKQIETRQYWPSSQQAMYPHQGPSPHAMYPHQGLSQQAMYQHQGLSQQAMYQHQRLSQQAMYPHRGLSQQTMYQHQGLSQQAMYPLQGLSQQAMYPHPQQAVTAHDLFDHGGRFNGIAHAGILDFRTCPDKLLELSMKITTHPIRIKVQTSYHQASKICNGFIDTFTYQGADVLRMKHNLARVKCPGKVDIDNLSRSLNVFKTAMKFREAETISFRTMIHTLVGECRTSMMETENRRVNASFEVSLFGKQIKDAEDELQRIQREIVQLQNAARELDNRVQDLNRQTEKYRQKGLWWGYLTAFAGFVLGFATAGATVVPALLIAGIGAKVNFNSAQECELNARRLQESAKDKSNDAQRQQELKAALKDQKNAKEQTLAQLEWEIRNLSQTNEVLWSIEQFLYDFIRKIGFITEVLQELDLKLYETDLENGTFKLLQELFLEDKLTYSEIAGEGLSELKIKWKELEAMLLPYYKRRYVH